MVDLRGASVQKRGDFSRPSMEIQQHEANLERQLRESQLRETQQREENTQRQLREMRQNCQRQLREVQQREENLQLTSAKGDTAT